MYMFSFCWSFFNETIPGWFEVLTITNTVECNDKEIPIQPRSKNIKIGKESSSQIIKDLK